MGVQHNVINLFKEQGLSQQAGYDKIDALLRERVRDWYIALSQIPAVNEKTDIETQRYIRGCEEIIVAALNWRYMNCPVTDIYPDAHNGTALKPIAILGSMRRKSGKPGRLISFEI